ncbi:hypothetical protein [Salmonella sp. s51228]|uniref:hypothetical protein n=1 Tax=Salmonella sp. s51228 TaxID=3159652 RepID=UPI0039816BE0
MNEVGSYKCICDEGFQVAGNNIGCHDIDECVNGNNNCAHHTCLNLVGSYTCL